MYNDLYKHDINDAVQFLIEKIDDASMPRNVLITGATGLIGRFLIDTIFHIAHKRSLNINIGILTRSRSRAEKVFSEHLMDDRFHLFEGDLSVDRLESCVCMEKIDLIIHLASHTHPLQYSQEPIATIICNINGTNNVLSLAKRYGAQVIFTSSVEIYGQNRGDVDLFNEDYLGILDCNSLRAGYPESKRCAEALCQAYIAQHNLDVRIVRLPRVYGPTMQVDDSKAHAQFLKKGLIKEDIVLKSDGNQLYSYLYVADVATAILYLYKFGVSGEVYNVADDRSNIRLKDLAKIIASLCGVGVTFELPSEVEKKGYSKATKALLDSKKINQIGWKAKYSIFEGLQHTLNIMST